MGNAWDQALSPDRPVVLEVKTGPSIAPLLPHITLAQAQAFASALMKGDPNQGDVIVDTFSHARDRGTSRLSASQ
jgi:pyruvate dehydrogenase (quinone)